MDMTMEDVRTMVNRALHRVCEMYADATGHVTGYSVDDYTPVGFGYVANVEDFDSGRDWNVYGANAMVLLANVVTMRDMMEAMLS